MTITRTSGAAQIPLISVAAVAASAGVVFAIEPFTGKVLLPRLGGGPSVWNTCIMAFQALLLAGYGYSVLLLRFTDLRKALACHTVLVIASIAVWPFAIRMLWLTPASGWPPVLWIVVAVVAGIGVPFAILSATSPLIQVWVSRSSSVPLNVHRLYAASNVASIAGLAVYVGVLEPLVGASRQSLVLWAAYALATTVSLMAARRAVASGANDPAATSVEPGSAPIHERISTERRIEWVALSFGASLCLYAVTTYIATDVGSFPLLWCLPLGIFLLGFAAGFSVWGDRFRIWLIAIARLAAIAALAHLVWVEDSRTVWVRLLVPLLTLGCLVTALSAELAHRRPHEHRLAGYYALVGLGGVLAGIACVILLPWAWSSLSLDGIAILEKPLYAIRALAPVFLTESVPEYAAALVLATALLSSWSVRGAALQLVASLAVATAIVVIETRALSSEWDQFERLRIVSFAVAVAFVVASSGTRVLAATASLALLGGVLQLPGHPKLFEARNFFGTSRVEADRAMHMLKHGTTLHGIQPTGPDADKPASYYTWSSPLGRVIDYLHPRSVIAVGLGVGTVAAYGNSGDRYRFLEINPLVPRIAGNPEWFTYVPRALARGVDLQILIGDGRLLAAGLPDHAWDLIIVDAFSSDAIPVHLLSLEAVQMFQQKLTPGGVIAYHISNRFFDLQPVVTAAATKAGMAWAAQSREGLTDIDYGSHWVMLTANVASAEAAGLTEAGWEWPTSAPTRVPWTDDWANVLGTMKSWRFWESD